MTGTAAPDTDEQDGIVLLTVVVPRNSRLTKTLGLHNGQWGVVRDYGRAYRVTAQEAPVHDIESLATVLTGAAERPDTCVIRGGIKPGHEARVRQPHGVRRLAYSRPNEADGEAAFEERARRWIAVDLDSLPLPEHIDPIGEVEHVIDAALDRLPIEFQQASCYYQLTAGHGIKPGGRVRLFFWLSRRVTNAEAKRWIPKSIADPCVHAVVQPIYTAAPLLPPGVADLLPKRHGVRYGACDAVEVPDLSRPASARSSAHGGTSVFDGSFEHALARIGDPPAYPDGAGYYGPVGDALKAVVRDVGSKVDTAQVLARVETVIRERIGNRGEAYLDHRLRDAGRLLHWLIDKAREREQRETDGWVEHHGLPAYYPGPVEPRDAALGRTRTVIGDFIANAGLRVAIKQEVQRRWQQASDLIFAADG